ALGPEPVHRAGDPGGRRRPRRAGRAAGRAAPRGLAPHPRGRRGARPRARHGGHRVGEGHLRGGRGPGEPGVTGPVRRGRAAARGRGARRPRPVAVGLAALAVAAVPMPVAALVARAPWRDLPGIVGDPTVREALWLSVVTATGATV